MGDSGCPSLIGLDGATSRCGIGAMGLLFDAQHFGTAVLCIGNIKSRLRFKRGRRMPL